MHDWMNKQHTAWLMNELTELVHRGVVDQETAERLRGHYSLPDAAVGKRSSAVALVVFGVLGACLMGLGVISILAYNWEDMSRPMRAFVSFLPLLAGLALSLWAIRRNPDSVAWKESAGSFHTLAIPATIGLIAQTYQISGDVPDFLFTCFLLALPVVYLLDAAIPCVLCIAAMTSWVFARRAFDEDIWLLWIQAALLAPYVWIALKRVNTPVRSSIIAWAICIASPFLLGAMLSELSTLWLPAYLLLFGAMQLEGGLIPQGKSGHIAFRLAGTLGLVSLGFAMCFSGFWDDAIDPLRWTYGRNPVDHVQDFVMLGLLGVGAAVACVRLYRQKSYRVFIMAGITAAGLLGYIVTQVLFLPLAATLLSNAVLVGCSIAYITMGLREERLLPLNVGVLILSAWIFMRFMDADIGFLIRGLVFIALGMGFLGVNFLVARNRRLSS